uniref:Crystaline entomocidal protoxin n=1 Tax=Bacillus thuringiensis subsp. entomocidus TaxID=1436 RepID=Q75VA2_BACTE|nr:putative mosquitocidal toxin [Bacillus thuringiensis serovar entomocidus]
MNPYQKKTEYEILDALPNYSNMVNAYSRYPLANNPQVPLQNTSYKDWLNMCQTINPLCTPINIDIDSLAASIAVVGSILALIPGPGEAIGFVLGTFSTILPILWPNGETKIWTDFAERGLQLFRPELGQDAIEILVTGVKSGYNALKNRMENFEQAFTKWKGNRTRSNAEQVIRDFDSVRDKVIDLKNDYMINPENKPAFINLYAQTANIDLILYQRGAVYGDDWEKDINGSISPFWGSKDYYESLKTKIEEYTNYCAETYRNSLNILKNKPNISWDTYNKYRREATLGALDLVALFPNYDMHLYPAATKTELTRKIYMPSFGLQQSNYFQSLEGLENALTHPPSLFTWLNELNLYTVRENFNPALQVSSLSGLQARSRYTQNPTILDNPAQGVRNGTSTQIGLNNLFVYKLSMSQYHHPNDCSSIAGISDMTFYKSDYNGNASATQTYQAGRNTNNVINTFMNGPQKASSSNNISIKQTKHILSDIKMIYFRTGGMYQVYDFGYSFAWTHTSVDPDNLIVPNRITQIPAVKALGISTDSKVVKGPVFIGGDLLLLKLQATIRIKTDHANTRYKIRVRYASNANTPIVLSSLQNTLTVTFPQTITHSTISELQYKDFQYVTFPGEFIMDKPSIDVAIRGVQNDRNDIWIDRIEFLPITQSVLDYTEEQNIEKSQKAVNDLFIN